MGATWWDWRLLLRWVLVNAIAYAVIVVAGVALEAVFAQPTTRLAATHWLLAVLGVAIVGAGVLGFVLGRWQWRLLRRRLPALGRRRWVVATLVPAFFLWILMLAPETVHAVSAGGDTITAFHNAFVQALVLGPLIGLAQATALRGQTSRWAWWLVANVTTYLFGAATYELGLGLFSDVAAMGRVVPAFPFLGFAFHGVWMLWVTDPVAVSAASGRTTVRPRRRRSGRPRT